MKIKQKYSGIKLKFLKSKNKFTTQRFKKGNYRTFLNETINKSYSHK